MVCSDAFFPVNDLRKVLIPLRISGLTRSVPLIAFLPEDDSCGKHCVADQEPRGYSPGWLQCWRVQEWSGRSGNQRHSPPCAWRSYAARYEDWHAGLRLMRLSPSAKHAGGLTALHRGGQRGQVKLVH